MITIIDNTEPYSPILKWRPKPVFRSEYEKEKYYAGRKKAWIEGENGIPGTLIHKTEEQFIKNRITGAIFRPECRDVDLMIHQEIEDCRKKGEADVIIKGRGIGLSCEMGCLANYFMRVYAGSTSLLTSSDQSKIASLFSDKIMTTFDNYDVDIRPIILNKNETKSSAYLKAEIKYRDANGKIALNKSEIYCKQTSEDNESASGFSGKGAIFGAVDEVFLHKRRKLLMQSSSSCYIDQATGQVTGFLFAGGSVEHTLTTEQLAELQILVNEIETNHLLGTIPARLTFIPAYWGKFMVNGHSDEKKAREWWGQTVEKLDKLEDKSALRAFRMNNPMSLDDIFELASGNKFEEDVQELIKIQAKNIRQQNLPLMKCRLSNVGGNVETIKSAKPNVFILEHPKQGVEYILGIDGVATGTESGEEEGSNVAAVITKLHDANGTSFSVPALYTERPKTVESSYIHILSLARYYNKFGGLKWIDAEGSNSTVDFFSTFLKNEGMIKYAMHRKDLSGKGNININKLFQPRDKHMMDWQFKWANKFLRKYAERIQMLPLLEDMLKTGNADILDAWLMTGIILGVDFDKPVVKKVAPVRQRPVFKVVNGATVREWITA